MKIQTLSFSLLFVFVLSACNIPNATTIPDENLVETAVAQTLTSQVFLITPLQTEDLPETQEPFVVTETIQPAEETATPTATETITPTATLEPENPKNNLGNPTRQYNFDDGAAFGLNTPYDDGNTRFEVTGGKLVMTSYPAAGYRGWRLTSPRPKNLYIEGEFRTRECSGLDHYGLVFRADDYTSGKAYYLAISCDGQYKLIKWDNSGSGTVKDWTSTDFLNQGSFQNNLIGIYAQDNNLTIYANDRKVDEISDGSLQSGGHIGVFIAGMRTPGFSVEMDSLTYWERP